MCVCGEGEDLRCEGLSQSYLCLVSYLPCHTGDYLVKSAQERAARVRACIYVKFKIGRNLLPVLKIITRTAQLHVDISHCC